MSKASRDEWRVRQASLQERMKGCMKNPGTEQLDAVLTEMHAYAAAAQNGSIEIPERFVAFS